MKRLASIAVALTLLAAGVVTAAATAHNNASATTAAVAAQKAGTVQVKLNVTKFVRQGRRLVAKGTAVATYRSQAGAPTVSRRPFTASVAVLAPRKAGPAAPCPVLKLQIDQISLDLLGLHVDVSKLILTVTANKDGGALGKLFCSLSEAQLTSNATASQLTSAAHSGGLATKGVGFGVPTRSLQAIGPGPCSIVDLLLGPLHLDLLGLVVDLNQVHLQITAAPDGGILGSLLCSLTNPTTSTTTTTTTTTPAPTP
jgi:hypothetical protein